MMDSLKFCTIIEFDEIDRSQQLTSRLGDGVLFFTGTFGESL